MELGNDKSGGWETSVVGGVTSAEAESLHAARGVDRHIEMIAVDEFKSCKSNARTHSHKQIRQIAASIERFGFCNPVLIGENQEVIAGHGRIKAAKLLGMTEVPALRLRQLSSAEKRAYVIADNRLAELAGWDHDMLMIELQGLFDLQFEVEVIGFDPHDLNLMLDDGDGAADQVKKPKRRSRSLRSGRRVSRGGDVWLLGAHQLHCGDDRNDLSDTAIDAAIRYWQRVAGKSATLAGASKTFAEIGTERASTKSPDTAGTPAAAKREVV